MCLQQVNSQNYCEMAEELAKMQAKMLPKYEGGDFAVWKARMIAYLSAIERDHLLSVTRPRRIVTNGFTTRSKGS